MSYIDKYSKIKPFVKLNITHNKKMFSSAEKSLITRYYNKLEAMGYLNREQEGYILKDISNTKYKIKNAPKLKATYINVGTRVVNGKIITDDTAQIKIKNGKIYVKRRGMPYKWEFDVDINRDWKLKPFVKHIIERMLPNKPKQGQIFIIGAGMYEMRSTGTTSLEGLAKEILKMLMRYKNSSDFMGKIIVYENQKSFKLRLSDTKKRKSKKLKKGKRN